jgi:hypothetical protein
MNRMKLEVEEELQQRGNELQSMVFYLPSADRG